MRLSLTGLVRNAKNNLKERRRLKGVALTLEAMQDIIVALLKGDESIENVREFLFSSEDINQVPYFNSLVSVTPKRKELI